MANIDRIKGDVGAYIAFHERVLMEQMLFGSPTLQHFVTIPKEAQAGTTILIPNIDMGEVLQPFQAQFNEKGDLKIGAETTIQRRHKANVGLEPDTLVGEWSGMKKLNGMNLFDESKQRVDMPLAQYAMNKIIARANHDREMKLIMTGKYQPAVDGSDSPAENGADGILQIMKDATINPITYGDRLDRNAAKLEPFVMGALPNGDKEAYNYFKEFKNQIPEVYREEKLKVFAPRTYCDRYAEDKQEMSSFRGQFSDGLKIDNTNMELYALPGLAGFDTVFACAPSNLVRFIHKNDGVGQNLRVNDAEIYKLKISGDFHECYGVANWDWFWSNDQIPTL